MSIPRLFLISQCYVVVDVTCISIRQRLLCPLFSPAPIWKMYPATSHAEQYITNSRYCGNLLCNHVWPCSLPDKQVRVGLSRDNDINRRCNRIDSLYWSGYETIHAVIGCATKRTCQAYHNSDNPRPISDAFFLSLFHLIRHVLAFVRRVCQS